MRKWILSMICCLLAVLGANAQELVVKSMRAATMDLSARVESRKDLNDVVCALVKVQLLAPGAVFEGNVIGDCDYRVNEYWVYMTHGSKILRVKHPNYLTLDIKFSDYLIDKLESRTTYTMVIALPDGATPPQPQVAIVDNPEEEPIVEEKPVVVKKTEVVEKPIKVEKLAEKPVEKPIEKKEEKPVEQPIVKTPVVAQPKPQPKPAMVDSVPEPVPMNLPPLQMKKEVFKKMHQANTLANKGKWEQAISLYAALAHYFPSYAQLQLNIANTYDTKYQANVDPMLSLNGAINAYRKYIDLESDEQKIKTAKARLTQLENIKGQ